MALNFDQLPKDNPGGSSLAVPKGLYHFEVKKAEMKTSQKSGNTYMSVQLQCSDPTTKASTTVFDMFFESDKPLLQYKLRQFIMALSLNLRGTFELKDLCKIIGGKKGIVALKIEENEGYSPRNVVDAFDDNIYLPLAATEDDSEVPFDASDSAEPNTPTERADSY